MMGALYLLLVVAMYVGGLVANYAAVTGDAKIVSIGSTVYAPLFRDLFFAGLGLTCLLALLLPLAQRWDRVHMATQNQSIS